MGNFNWVQVLYDLIDYDCGFPAFGKRDTHIEAQPRGKGKRGNTRLLSSN